MRFLAISAVVWALALGGCAAPQGKDVDRQVGRSRVALPSGPWEELGSTGESVALLPGRAIPLQTSAWGLRSSNKELLAVLRIQTNRANKTEHLEPVAWPTSCDRQAGVTVVDATRGDRIRANCLRIKHWVPDARWLAKDQPALAQWLDARQVVLGKPYTYVGYRYTTGGGEVVAVDALVDHRLLHPVPHSNEDFLRADQPAETWAADLAQAVRVSAGMMDGYLAIPPFPLPVK